MALQMPLGFHAGCLGLRNSLLGSLIEDGHKHFFRSDLVLFMSFCLWVLFMLSWQNYFPFRKGDAEALG